MLWISAISFTKYAAIAYLVLSVGVGTYLYAHSRSWKQVFSVLHREKVERYKGLPRQLTYALKAIHVARFSAAAGAATLLLIMLGINDSSGHETDIADKPVVLHSP
ncbi:hypothetical protein [Ferribacterium limneticum]|uniref:hypothetical protein n=1 Tax=Ferribacterium limneticum TaxID=76259 RepID=UPI001CFADEB2|nr:hypothetical protein [Ferribacterium limneticum]UCV18158.1 hypothetical protein KI610_15270 [Ferribacterium limneticum]